MNPAIAELRGSVWAMERVRLKAFFEHVTAAPWRPGAIDMEAARRTQEEAEGGPGYDVVARTAVIPIRGLILKDVPLWVHYYGYQATGTRQTREALDGALADDAVDAILLAVDSPGGIIDGVQELADAFYAAREIKPVYAYIEDLGASAAYWLASQAAEVAANRTAEVGSIGVYTVLWDFSKYYGDAGVRVILVASGPDKGVGVIGVPIADEQLAPIAEVVDGMASIFMEAVARGRQMPLEAVRAVATGRTYLAQPAVELGLLDGVLNSDEALAAVTSA